MQEEWQPVGAAQELRHQVGEQVLQDRMPLVVQEWQAERLA